MTVEIKNQCNKCHSFWPYSNELFNIMYKEENYLCDVCIMQKSIKRYDRKSFAYHALIYLPPALFIGFHYGFFEEALWVFGGIYLLILPTIRDWLAERF